MYVAGINLLRCGCTISKIGNSMQLLCSEEDEENDEEDDIFDVNTWG